MKHIVCTVTNDLTYDQRMQRICTSLANADYQVTLVGRKLSTSVDLVSQNYQQYRLTCFFNKGKLFYLEYNIRLFFYLLTQKIDCFYAVDLDTILPNFIVSKIKGKNCIYDAHEYFTETPEVVRRRSIQRIWEVVAKWTIPQITHCITVGHGLAEIMGKRYQKTFSVVRNVPFYTSTINEKIASKPILLYQGMLNEGRGIEAMIEAMEGIENAMLWLVGEGDLSEELRMLVAAKGLDKKVKFWGFVKPQELKSITKQATVGLNLLENKGLSYYYSLANKAFDYVQANLPSIQMNFPEYQRLNEQHEVFYLIDNLEVKTIQFALEELLKSKKLYDKLQQNCQLAAKEWCWEKEEKVLLSVVSSY